MSGIRPFDPDEPQVQLLTPDGERVSHPHFAFDGDDLTVRSLFRDLFLTRRLDTEATALQRHGELGLWAQCLGQEAAQVGAGRALAEQDWVFPTYREHGVAWCREIDPVDLLGLWRGTTLGGWDPEKHRMAMIAIVIGAQTLHATGYAMGLTLDGLVGHDDPARDTAVLTFLGDGATSQGDVSEAFTWAASFQAPVVFFVQNNHFAISVPTDRQSRTPIAQRATGFGFPGIRVDGNDVLATYAVTRAALDRARSGQGPVLIEAETYRMGAHTTSDDPTRYRESEEVESWRRRDPLLRVERYLRNAGTPESFFVDLEEEAEALGVRMREACRALPPPDLATLFEFVHAEMTPELVAQQAEFVAHRASFEEAVR